MKMLGVDVGSTFTDLVLYDSDSESLTVYKVPSTQDDQSQGVLEGVKEICQIAGIRPSQLSFFSHGTTVATNTMLTNKGARTGLITTKGFRDVIYIGRHHRPLNYSIIQEIPWHHRQPVPRRYRKEVTERVIPPDGETLVPLDENEAIQVVQELKKEGVQSIAVCFLFSYLNSSHEERMKELINEYYPGCYVSTSSGIFPQFREFERFITTAINACLTPTISKYILNMEKALGEVGVTVPLHFMQSNSGLCTTKLASEKPVTLLLSGPAAGVGGGIWAASHMGLQRLITLDMGGTSTDVGVVTEMGIMEATARDTWIAGFPLMVPTIDVGSIGAGGGSICYLDVGGALRVGPESAAANPGPACYDLGGVAPTITDAHVVLGRLRPEYFLGGRMRIKPSLSEKALAELGRKMNMDHVSTAAAIIRIANENMSIAVRSRTVERGISPEDFILIALGGAGPLHAVDLAQLIGIPRVLIPNFPGITSAIGLLVTDIRYDDVRTLLRPLDEISPSTINGIMDEMLNPIIQQLHKDGCLANHIKLRKTADVRYIGQGYEVRIELPTEPLGEDAALWIREAFENKHQEEYDQVFSGVSVELVNLMVTAFGTVPRMSKRRLSGSSQGGTGLIKTEEVYFTIGEKVEKLPAGLYDRTSLRAGQRIPGPAIIVQMDSTSVIPPDALCTIDDFGNLVVDIGNRAHS